MGEFFHVGFRPPNQFCGWFMPTGLEAKKREEIQVIFLVVVLGRTDRAP